jgi:hypothetical protein
MSIVKTTWVMAILTLASPAPGQTHPGLTMVFAECIGRFSAETEHAWLMGDPEADFYATRRTTFLSLLQATAPESEARRALSYRIEVKMAHAQLLSLATFGTNKQRAERARYRAKHHIDTCLSLLLDS